MSSSSWDIPPLCGRENFFGLMKTDQNHTIPDKITTKMSISRKVLANTMFIPRPCHPYWRRLSPRSTIQCQAECAMRADKIIVHKRLEPPYKVRRCKAGIVRAIRKICPNSIPILKKSKEAVRCDPANWKVSRSENENPKPWMSPKRKVIIHRCFVYIKYRAL